MTPITIDQTNDTGIYWVTRDSRDHEDYREFHRVWSFLPKWDAKEECWLDAFSPQIGTIKPVLDIEEVNRQLGFCLDYGMMQMIQVGVKYRTDLAPEGTPVFQVVVKRIGPALEGGDNIPGFSVEEWDRKLNELTGRAVKSVEVGA